MSLFQCEKCGCVENTALSTMGHRGILDWRDTGEDAAILSYREILGLRPDQPLGCYCCVCSPVWYDKRNHGIGPNPNPTPGMGLWHDEFPRDFLPLGTYRTDQKTGNLTEIKCKVCGDWGDVYFRERPGSPSDVADVPCQACGAVRLRPRVVVPITADTRKVDYVEGPPNRAQRRALAARARRRK